MIVPGLFPSIKDVISHIWPTHMTGFALYENLGQICYLLKHLYDNDNTNERYTVSIFCRMM